LRLTKGGAVRTRIALSTALAVLIVVPVLLFALSSSNPVASARIRHEAGSRHRAARIDMKLMSDAQAQKATQLATFYNAVTAQQEETYLEEISYLKEVAYLKGIAYIQALAAQRSAAASPLPVTAGGGSDATSTNTPDWACIRQHESNGDYSIGGGGAYQFELGTWEGLTGLGTPAENSPPSVQDAAALRLFAERGWEPWTTRHVCGL
jgi:muramidase (phage lysozyme)